MAIFALALACGTQNRTVANASPAAKNDTVRIANDSLEYEAIIIDPGFSSWLSTRALPRHYYSQQYLENKNRWWVPEFNNRVTNLRYSRDLYEQRIDYEPGIDYGYEVNYLLYNYLVYFQNKFNQHLGGHVPDR